MYLQEGKMSLFKGGVTGVLSASDIGPLQRFYEVGLGLRKVSERDTDSGKRILYAVSEDGFIEIREGKEDLPQGPTSFWMQAHDIDGMYETLRKEGVVEVFEPIEDKYFHARSFQLRDPAGDGIFCVCYEKDILPYTKDCPKEAFFDPEFRTVLFVRNLDSCYRFYTQVLEMPCIYSWDECPGDRGFKYQVDEGKGYIETLHRIPLTDQKNAAVLLNAVNLKDCYARISAKEDANIVVPPSQDAEGILRFELEDPDGNRIIIRG